MDFFKSVFSDEPEADRDLDLGPQTQTQVVAKVDDESASAWSFGGLIKTLASKSESVIQTYKKDLEELSSELKKETQVIREVATKAVRDLPASLEVGASVAQESLESVGQAIDDLGSTVWRGTAGIITHHPRDKDVDDDDDDTTRKYTTSRFDSQIRLIQTDFNTYVGAPQDFDDFHKWKTGFVLGDKDEEIDTLLAHNLHMDNLYRNLVPNTINDDTFWTRYFYKIYKLKQVEEARANLVKRAIAGDDEDLSWDVDDEEDSNAALNTQLENNPSEGPLVDKSSNVDTDIQGHGLVSQVQPGLVEGNSALSKSDDQSMNDKSEVLDDKTDQADSCKDSDVSIVSTQPSLPEEQDLSWDEIEDLSGIDDKKSTSVSSNSPSRADLHKRLSLPDEEEDLSWDIEDDD